MEQAQDKLILTHFPENWFNALTVGANASC